MIPTSRRVPRCRRAHRSAMTRASCPWRTITFGCWGAPPPSTGGRPGTTQVALGWNIYTDGSREIVWKNGSVSGFRAFMGYEPTTRLGVVALINAQTAAGADDIGLHLLDANIEVVLP